MSARFAVRTCWCGRGKAEILESHERPAALGRARLSDGRTSSGSSPTCACRAAVTRRISRRVLFARDGWQCAYCGSGGNRLTLDHVVPRSRGGTSVWENVVTSCAPCNHRKGDRLLEETSMSLRTAPRPPTPVLFIRLTAEHVPDVWRQYLPGLDHSRLGSRRGGLARLYRDIARSTASCSSGESATDERPRSRSFT